MIFGPPSPRSFRQLSKCYNDATASLLEPSIGGGGIGGIVRGRENSLAPSSIDRTSHLGSITSVHSYQETEYIVPRIHGSTKFDHDKNETGDGSDDQDLDAEDQKQTLWRKLYHILGLKHLIPVSVLVLYSLFGAAIFYAVETPICREKMREARYNLTDAQSQMKERVWELKLEANYTKADVYDRAEKAIRWYDSRVSQMADSKRMIVDFSSAVFYCATIYTTIGYGTIVPITVTGKIVTMLYSIIGIPLVFIILNGFGDSISRHLMSTWFAMKTAARHVKVWLRCRRRPKKVEQKSSNNNNNSNDNNNHPSADNSHNSDYPSNMVGGRGGEDNGEHELHELPMSVALLFTLGWILMCSAVFRLWESEWTYFTAFYFFFVSLTTIGLGDTIPEHIDYLMFNFWLLLLGLSMVSMCIQVEHMMEMILLSKMKEEQEAQIQMMEEAEMDEQQRNGTKNGGGGSIGSNLTPKSSVGGRKNKMEEKWNRKVQMKVKGVQAVPQMFDASAQTDDFGGDETVEDGGDAEKEDAEIIVQQRIQITELLAQIQERERELEEMNRGWGVSNIPQQGSYDPMLFPLMSDIGGGGGVLGDRAKVHYQNTGGVPYRECRTTQPREQAITDPGKHLLGELSWRIHECQNILNEK